MEIHFLGVGEACDGNQTNTSILLKTDSRETAGQPAGTGASRRWSVVNTYLPGLY